MQQWLTLWWCCFHAKKGFFGVKAKFSTEALFGGEALQSHDTHRSLFQTWASSHKDKHWHDQRGEKERKGRKSLMKLQNLPFPFCITHTKRELSYSLRLRLMWSDNLMISERSHASGAVYKFTQRLAGCSSVSQTEHKHTETFGSFILMAWLWSCYRLPQSSWTSVKALRILHSGNKFVI